MPDAGVAALFARCFGTAPPVEPRHFAAYASAGTRLRPVGYIHFIAIEAGVYLCGGLCIDSRIYRELPRATRETIAGHGSLSRWLSVRAIEGLGDKRAVFAYTGDARSRRDAGAIGFQATAGRFLLVQWHSEPDESRLELVEKIARIGPF